MIFVSAKYLINTRFVSMMTVGQFQSGTNLFVSYILMFAVLIISIFIFSYLFTSSGKHFKYEMRIKDNFAIMCYAQILNAAALFVLFPIELVLFGDYLFSINPTPFAIKETLAYLMLITELFVIGWSFFLTYKAFFTQLKNISTAVITSIIFFLFISVIILLASKFIFTLS